MIVENKYIGLISGRLQLFKRKNDSVWNFRCPFCGDSKKKKSKTRGFLLGQAGRISFYCHNCNLSYSFGNFLKRIDGIFYQEYMKEKFVERSQGKISPPKKPDITVITPAPSVGTPLASLKKISQLHPEHPCKKYIVARQIPTQYHFKLYYAPKFKHWVNSFMPDKFDLTKEKDEPRFVIPFFDKNKNLFMIQGRAFYETDVRYISIVINRDTPRVFGLDTADLNKAKLYVVEGPIDSMFIDNCIAMGGADIVRFDLPDKPKCTIIFDNEPRNKEITKRMKERIEDGYGIFFWPENYDAKDINDLVVKKGMSKGDIKWFIDMGTSHDLTAQLRLAKWKK